MIWISKTGEKSESFPPWTAHAVFWPTFSIYLPALFWQHRTQYFSGDSPDAAQHHHSFIIFINATLDLIWISKHWRKRNVDSSSARHLPSTFRIDLTVKFKQFRSENLCSSRADTGQHDDIFITFINATFDLIRIFQTERKSSAPNKGIWPFQSGSAGQQNNDHSG